MSNPWAFMNGTGRPFGFEESVIVQWLRTEGFSLRSIARMTGRHRSSIYKHLICLARHGD